MFVSFRKIAFVAIIIFGSRCFASDIFVTEIIIKDHIFEPSIVDVPSGRKIKLIVHNRDSTVEEFDSPSLNRERIIPAHSSVNIILAPLKKGVYEFVGEFHQETAKGVLQVD